MYDKELNIRLQYISKVNMLKFQNVLVILAILSTGLALNLATSPTDPGAFEFIINGIKYGTVDDSACYTKCKRGEICTVTTTLPKVTTCTPYCGDGILAGNEGSTSGCDDGNTIPSDGCTNCRTDSLWDCSSSSPGGKSTCRSTCGNGIVEIPTGQKCDDRNRVNGDGCSYTCQIVASWTCSPTPISPVDTRTSVCIPICGDGVRVGSQLINRGCDDGNKRDGDGCSAICKQEKNWVCSGSPYICTYVCGNNKFDSGAEECDNAGGTADDGCTSDCTIDSGWTCDVFPNLPSKCFPICGDGILQGREQCDMITNGNNLGCTSYCSVVRGWTCLTSKSVPPVSPSVCTTICGDGQIWGQQTCDDGPTKNDVSGNPQSGDGCSSQCKVENGWTCEEQPSMCFANCGDSIVSDTEQCDHGTGNNAGDVNHCLSGCSGYESGWTCTGSGGTASCTTTCGDGVKAGSETCDHGTGNNLIAIGSCSAGCSLFQAGWYCPGRTTLVPCYSTCGTCATVCGDNIIAGTEQCDNGSKNNIKDLGSCLQGCVLR